MGTDGDDYTGSGGGAGGYCGGLQDGGDGGHGVILIEYEVSAENNSGVSLGSANMMVI